MATAPDPTGPGVDGSGAGVDRTGDGVDGSGPSGADPAAAAPTDTAATGAQKRSGGRSALLRAGSVMTAGTAVSRALGFVRASVLITAVGLSTGVADAFALANTVPNALYLLVAGGVLNAVLVPQLVRAMARGREEGGDGGDEYVDRLVTAAVLVLGVAALLLTLGAPLVVGAYSGGIVGEALTGPQRDLPVALAYWCLPQVFFYGVYTLLGQVLNARGSFGPYMWAPVVNNVVGIAGIVVFIALVGARDGADDARAAWTAGEVALLAGSATLGVVAQALVLLVPLRRSGVRLRVRFGVRGMGLRTAGRVAGWTFAALVVGQVGWLAMTTVASGARAATAAGDVGTPGVAAWTTSYLVFMLPHSLVAVSVVTALFTRMSTSAAAGRLDEVREALSTGLRTIGVASALAVTGILVLAGPVVVAISELGEQGRATAPVLSAMGVGLVAFSALYLAQRVFYAMEDARTPFLLQCVTVGVWLVGSVVSAVALAPADRVVGVAAAMSLGTTIAAVIALALLRRRLGGVDGRRVVRTHVRLVLASLVAAGLGLTVSGAMGADAVDTRVDAIVVVAVTGSVMTGAYLLMLRAMRVEEVAPLLDRLVPVRLRSRPRR